MSTGCGFWPDHRPVGNPGYLRGPPTHSYGAGVDGEVLPDFAALYADLISPPCNELLSEGIWLLPPDTDTNGSSNLCALYNLADCIMYKADAWWESRGPFPNPITPPVVQMRSIKLIALILTFTGRRMKSSWYIRISWWLTSFPSFSTLATWNCYCDEAPDDTATHACCNIQGEVYGYVLRFVSGGWGLVSVHCHRLVLRKALVDLACIVSFWQWSA
jgi:hypothetical protein